MMSPSAMTLPFTNATSPTPLPTAGVTATSEGGSSFAKVLKQQGDNTPAGYRTHHAGHGPGVACHRAAAAG
ncbi:hypothetical protein, partial [Bordetella hinzii]|uniref:hypothetical protein n=1 Tax=Bordetella hinzii TaxID=103855 RepID=UPI0005198B73